MRNRATPVSTSHLTKTSMPNPSSASHNYHTAFPHRSSLSSGRSLGQSCRLCGRTVGWGRHAETSEFGIASTVMFDRWPAVRRPWGADAAMSIKKVQRRMVKQSTSRSRWPSRTKQEFHLAASGRIVLYSFRLLPTGNCRNGNCRRFATSKMANMDSRLSHHRAEAAGDPADMRKRTDAVAQSRSVCLTCRQGNASDTDFCQCARWVTDGFYDELIEPEQSRSVWRGEHTWSQHAMMN